MEYQSIAPTFNDRILRCYDCGNSFVWTAGEQVYYHRKSLSEPKRCQSCRELRKRTLPNLDGTINRAREEIHRW